MNELNADYQEGKITKAVYEAIKRNELILCGTKERAIKLKRRYECRTGYPEGTKIIEVGEMRQCQYCAQFEFGDILQCSQTVGHLWKPLRQESEMNEKLKKEMQDKALEQREILYDHGSFGFYGGAHWMHDRLKPVIEAAKDVIELHEYHDKPNAVILLENCLREIGEIE